MYIDVKEGFNMAELRLAREVKEDGTNSNEKLKEIMIELGVI